MRLRKVFPRCYCAPVPSLPSAAAVATSPSGRPRNAATAPKTADEAIMTRTMWHPTNAAFRADNVELKAVVKELSQEREENR